MLTALFSTLGMSLLTFLSAAVLGLPKQLAVVYVGVSSSDAGESHPCFILGACRTSGV